MISFDLLARFTRFLNLVVAAALRAGSPQSAWQAEGWSYAYLFELRLINEGLTYDDYHREWMEMM